MDPVIATGNYSITSYWDSLYCMSDFLIAYTDIEYLDVRLRDVPDLDMDAYSTAPILEYLHTY